MIPFVEIIKDEHRKKEYFLYDLEYENKADLPTAILSEENAIKLRDQLNNLIENAEK